MRPLPRVAVLLCALCAVAALAAPNLETLSSPRKGHSAVLLRDGTVLVLGGNFIADGGHVAQVERFVPWLGWVDAGQNPLAPSTGDFRTALLHDGRVLIVGYGVLTWNPATGVFRSHLPVPSQANRIESTLTVLQDGRVLLAGGVDTTVADGGIAGLPWVGSVDANGELSWAPVANALPGLRRKHTATLMRDGKVLLVGGSEPANTNGVNPLAVFTSVGGSNQLYWVDAGVPSTRNLHTTTRRLLGELVVMGNEVDPVAPFLRVDPLGGLGYSVGLQSRPGAATDFSQLQCAVLNTNGDVLTLGGLAVGSPYPPVSSVSAQLGSNFNAFVALNPMVGARAGHTATLLMDGKVLVYGGDGPGGPPGWELVDPVGFVFNPSGSQSTPRGRPTATPLPNGKVLLAGGNNPLVQQMLGVVDSSGAATVYNSLIPMRFGHTATMLTSDEVLITGGLGRLTGQPLADCWLVDVDTAVARPCAPMNAARFRHTATLLATGQVLVTGGVGPLPATGTSAEIFDPNAPNGGRWTLVPQSMPSSRSEHAAVLLPSGTVLLTGGRGGSDSSAYFLPNSSGGSFTPGPPLTAEHLDHTLTLMRDGRVLLAGGSGQFAAVATDIVELLGRDGGWARAGEAANPTRLAEAAEGHGAAALPTGDVVLAGGASTNLGLKAHRFSPLTELFTFFDFPAGSGRKNPRVLVSNFGAVLVLDGSSGVTPNPVWAYSTTGDNWSPYQHTLTSLIRTVSPLDGGYAFELSGPWDEASEASSGGAQNSAVNVPRLVFQRLDNGQVIAPTGYSFIPDGGLFVGSQGPMPQGQYRAWAYISGVPGRAAWFRVGSVATSEYDAGVDGGPAADGGTPSDGGNPAGDGGNPSSDGGTGYGIVLRFPAAPDPKYVGVPVTAQVQIFAPPGTPGDQLVVTFKPSSEQLEVCDKQQCPADAGFALRGSGTLDDTGQTLTVRVRPLAVGKHTLTATLGHGAAVQGQDDESFNAAAFDLSSGGCGCSSAGGLGALALLALALQRRRRR
jgi:uncharacterized protein (TIGR03382 family)